MTRTEVQIVPRKTYIGIWAVLMLLLALNCGLAEVDLGPFNLVASLTIAFVQAFLMLVYLMHARYETTLTRLFVAVGFIWLLIMFDLTLSDYLTRGGLPGTLRDSWKHGAWPTVTRKTNSP
jgi:cytochrome c oxidase subunit 4